MLTACASSVKSTACSRSVIFLAVYDLFTTACCNSVHNSIAAVLSQQDAADLFPTALLQFCHNSLQQIWRQSVASMWRQAATCRANASDMRPVDDIPQQAGNRPAATCANLAVYYRVDTIVSTLWQCWTILLTTLNNVGSTTLFKAVFINPEQVVRFLLCTQPVTPQTCCKLRTLPACCKLSTSCSKSVDFIKLQQVCENQPCCNLIFADLLQVVVTICSKLVDNKSWEVW